MTNLIDILGVLILDTRSAFMAKYTAEKLTNGDVVIKDEAGKPVVTLDPASLIAMLMGLFQSLPQIMAMIQAVLALFKKDPAPIPPVK